jgi:hypothetical protein
MATATFTFYQCFSEDLAEKVHNLDTDTFKWMLSNTAPNVATHTVRADASEIGAGNGYASGGIDAQISTSRSGSTTTISGVDTVFTASGGAFNSARYAILYNATAAGEPLVGYIDHGSSFALPDTKTYTVDVGASLFTLGVAA